MKSFESRRSERAVQRRLMAGVIAGIIVVVAVVAAVVAAPLMSDSISTLNLSSSQLEVLVDSGVDPLAAAGIDVSEISAAPVEPLTMSY